MLYIINGLLRMFTSYSQECGINGGMVVCGMPSLGRLLEILSAQTFL